MCELGWILLLAQMVVNPPTIEETWVPSLGQEDPPEKEMATCSSTLAWRVPWTWGRKESHTTERPSLSLITLLSKMYGACGISSGPMESERNMRVGVGLGHFFL